MTLQELLNFSYRQLPILFTEMIFCVNVTALYQEKHIEVMPASS